MESQTNDRLRGGSEAAAVKSVVDRARIEGPDVYLEVLNDRLVWNKTSVIVQDLAIQEVARRISPEFQFVETNVYSCGGQTHRIAAFQHIQTKIKLNLLPAGNFMQGSDTIPYYPMDSDIHWALHDSSHPKRQTLIKKPFLAGQRPLSQYHWDQFSTPDYREEIDSSQPMVDCSWEQAIVWLGQFMNELRLPSESEWEYACRAGTSSRYFWGEQFDARFCDCVWHSSDTEDFDSLGAKVTFLPNAFGLFEMLGGVWEYCYEDWVIDHYLSGSYDFSNLTSKGNKISRGGSRSSSHYQCLCGYRINSYFKTSDHSIGMRVFADVLDSRTGETPEPQIIGPD